MKALAFSRAGRALAALLATQLWIGGCVPGSALAPVSGSTEIRDLGLVRVPGGQVDAAGGNLLLSRSDLSVDTVLGRQEIGAVYNSASGTWLWSFQIRYDGAEFLDPTGAVHDVAQLTDGAAIPGTHWLKVDARTIASKGGLVHRFASDASLERVHWRAQELPCLEYVRSGGTLAISQCSAGGGCSPVFAVMLDAGGQPASAADSRSGRTASYRYDDSGRLEEALTPADVESGRPGRRYEYGAAGSTLLTAVTSPEGERVEYAYQAGRRIRSVRQVGEGDPTHRFEFQARNGIGLSPTLHTNPLGGRTRYLFDGERRLRSREQLETGDLGRIEWIGMRPSRLTSPAGVVTELEYAEDDLVRRIEPSGNVVDFVYEPGATNVSAPFARPLRRVDDALGPILEHRYDALGWPESVLNGEGEEFRLVYEGGRLVAAENPAGAAWTFPLHGVHGHWLRREGPAPDRREIDPAGNVLVPSMGEQPGGFLRRGYDADRNLVSIEAAASVDGEVTSQAAIEIARRSDGQPLSVVRPEGADHVFEYDALGRLRSRRERVDGSWQTAAFEYDAAGNLSARSLDNGMREEFLYDAYGRLLRHTALRDGVVEGTLDQVWQQGRVAAVWDSLRDAGEIRSYDAAGRVAGLAFTTGEAVAFEYDARSRLAREVLSLPAGGPSRTIEFAHDRADRLLLASTDEGPLLEWSYGNGGLETVRYGNGLVRRFGLDPAGGGLRWAETRDAADARVARSDVTWSADGAPPSLRVRARVETPLGVSVERYTLERGGSLSRLEGFIGRRVYAWSDEVAQQRSYAYDALSNRVAAAPGDAFVYNAEGNRLLSATVAETGESVDYAWDEAGYATERNGKPITWTATGRLASYGDAEIHWDMRGRPISVSAGGLTRSFRLFGGAVEGDFESGAGWIDLGEVTIPFQGEARVFRHYDFRGNTSFESDETGAVVSHRHYSAYALEADLGGVGPEEGLAGGRAFEDLTVLGVRVYDSAVGRFLSPDPVYQLGSAYAYAQGNPVQYWDPDGAQAAPANSVEARVSAGVQLAASVLGVSGTTAGLIVAASSTTPLGVFVAASGFAAAILFFIHASKEAYDAFLVPPNPQSANATRVPLPHSSNLAGAIPVIASPSVSVCAPTGLRGPNAWSRAAYLFVAIQILLAALWVGGRMRTP